MGPLAWIVAIVLLALPVSAGQRKQSFQVHTVVVRSAVVRAGVSATGASQLRLAGARALAVQVDSAPMQMTAGEGEVALPQGTRMVTILY